MVCALIVVLALALTGCGAAVDVYEQQDEDTWYFIVDIRLERLLVETLEESAADSEKYGRDWTVEDWLRDYFEVIADYHGFLYRYDGMTVDASQGNQHCYRFTVNASKADSSEEVRTALTLEGESHQKTNLFLRTISVVRDDRFNWWINEYADVLRRFENDSPSPMDGASMMGIFLFGSTVWTGNGDQLVAQQELPGFSEAFPAAQLHRYTEIALKNFWYASQKMNVSYDDKIPAVDENGTVDRRGVYYVFAKDAGEGDTVVEYDYYRADPTGWYLVALVGGGLAIGLVILIARMQTKRQNKQPPAKPEDSFPYDPFAEYNGGGSRDNNPFEGY